MIALLALNVCLFALLVMGGIVFHCRYLHPLRRLIRDIKAVRYGQATAVPPDHHPSELGLLAHEYNRLFQALADTDDKIYKIRSHFERKAFHRTEEFRKNINHLQEVAQTDPLTGLANRVYLNQYLDFVFDQSRKCGTRLCCLLIDIDDFKIVNDHLGHEKGDEVLRFMGELLHGCLREHDFAARFGGDEFVVLLPNCPDKTARHVAERIRTLFAREAWRFQPKSNSADPQAVLPAPRLSIGLASMKNLPRNAGDLLRLADQSLYRAKQAGKNRIVCG